MPDRRVDPVVRQINRLSRSAAVDILDNALGVTCYDSESVSDLRALVARHYKAGLISVEAVL